MADVPVHPPFPAYRGPKPFVFVSYAHKNGEAVFADLDELHKRGIRIWYDEGIDPGNEWPEEIAKALALARIVLVFITPAAVASRNVRNEVDYALSQNKTVCSIHLLETTLPPGMELRLGSVQAIMKYRMSPDNYWKKLISCLPDDCRDSPICSTIQNYLEQAIEKKCGINLGPLHAYFAESGCSIVALKENTPVARWPVPSDLSVVADELFKLAKGEDPWRPDDEFLVELTTTKRPFTGNWYKASGSAVDLDLDCQICGHTTYITPADGERPPPHCPHCGA